MFETFFPILLLLILAAVVAVAFAALSIILGRRTRIGKKGEPYECGMEPVGSTKDPIPVKFYLVAISFILFDIEVVMLPRPTWALVPIGDSTGTGVRPVRVGPVAIGHGIKVARGHYGYTPLLVFGIIRHRYQ